MAEEETMPGHKVLLKMVFGICLLLVAVAWSGVAAACKDKVIKCWGPAQDQGGPMVVCGTVKTPAYYDWAYVVCMPKTTNGCTVSADCNKAYPSCCKGDCKIYWKGWQGANISCPQDFRPPY